MAKKKTKKSKGLKLKTVARIEMLKVMPYKGIMIYLRLIDEEIFEYLVPFKGEVYSAYLVIKPSKGKKKLSKDQIAEAGSLIFQSAVVTVDYLLGNIKVGKKTKGMVDVFEKSKKPVYKN